MSDGVVCPRCSQNNAANQRFCGSCGASLTARCSGCGQENPPTFRFCGGCGLELTGPPQPETGPRSEERRWATVLFGDLSGFTRLSERMDPEDVTLLIDRCMNKLGEVAQRYGGRVERVTGDEIMVVFGAPVAHEDDPERAVRTALEMQRITVEQSEEFGGLLLRIGVNTGEVMFAPVGPADARQFTVMGDAVNVAARLETAALPGRVFVGEETYRAAHRSAVFEEVDTIDAKGRDQPVRVWLAVEAAAPQARPLSELPLVGREDELELLQGTWRRVAASSHAHLVTILGQAGIGKSKLAREFIGTLDRPNCWGRSLPYGERAGGAFGQIIRQLADVYVTDTPHVARDKLAATVESLFGAPDQALAAHLATIVGQGAEEDVDRAQLFAAARRFVGRLAEDGPMALVFEDVQWADESLLELIQWLVKGLGHAPILFLTLTRPELLDSHPGWGGGIAAHTSLPLEPLPPEYTRELAHRIRGGLDEATLDRIEESSGGNPLFVEELTAWLSDASPDDRRSVPTTVTSIVAARLDALPTPVRQVLLDASVVGLSFWRGSLEHLAQTSVTTELDDLVAHELIRKQATSRVPGDDEYLFRHQLIRDVAYDILPKAIRRERHRAAARYIEERVPKTEVVAGMLAHHWREAGDDVRAVTYLLEAAEVASRGWEQREAIELLKQATKLVPPDDPALKRRVAMRAGLVRQKYVHAVMDEASIRRAAASSDADLHEH